TSERFSISARTPCRSPARTARTRSLSPAAASAAAPHNSITAVGRTALAPFVVMSSRLYTAPCGSRRRLQGLRASASEQFNRPRTRAEGFDRTPEPIRLRQPEIADLGPVLLDDVTVALPHASADDQHRQRIGRVD